MCIGWNYSVTKQAALSIRPSNDMNKTTMKKFLKHIIFLVMWSAKKRKWKKEILLAASKSRPQVVPMKEERTQLLTESLVRNGRRHILIITVSLMWEITTSAGILTELLNPKFGVTQQILNTSARIAWFRFAHLWRLSTSLWTMTRNLARWRRITHLLLFKRKSFPHRSQSAFLSWLKPGSRRPQERRKKEITQLRHFFSYLIAKERPGSM